MCAASTTTLPLAKAFPILRDMVPREGRFHPKGDKIRKEKANFAGIDFVRLRRL
jgi:hypothetical protein